VVQGLLLDLGEERWDVGEFLKGVTCCLLSRKGGMCGSATFGSRSVGL
jgi:hypothetical protein